MGMSIDEAIEQIIECKAYKQCDTEKDSEAFEVAIDTMRKYRKITEIVEAWKADVDIDSYDCIADIYEVIGNGKIN